MIRKQLYIDEELDRALKVLAAWTGQSEAQHVRTALRRYLAEHALQRSDEDPLLELVGLVGDPDGPGDVARNHDEYLYGPEPGRPRSGRAT
jgi:Ribbon-helix-helix protein, copG family